MDLDGITKVCVTAFAIAVVAAAALLTWHGSLTGAQFLGTIASTAGLLTAGATTAHVVKTASTAARRP